MAVCRNCGAQIGDNDSICSNCGANQQAGPAQYNNPQQYNSQVPAEDDQGGFLWGLLGCCVPLVGLILYLIWKDTKPKSANAAGKGALISVIVSVVVVVVYFVLLFIIGMIAAASM